jgi:hypothetical protein
MCGAHLRLGVSLRFLRPPAEDFLAELPEFFDHAILGAVGIGAVGGGLIQRVEEVMQAGAQLGPMGQALLEHGVGLVNRGRRYGFIVHQPLYLYSG